MAEKALYLLEYIVLAVTITLVPSIPILMYSPAQQCLMVVIVSEQIKVTVAGSAAGLLAKQRWKYGLNSPLAEFGEILVDSVGEWSRVQSLKCVTLGFESWRFQLELNRVQGWMS